MLKFSTYEQAFEELLENEGLKKKAAKSGISYGTLKKVYNRGMAAWRTGHRLSLILISEPTRPY